MTLSKLQRHWIGRFSECLHTYGEGLDGMTTGIHSLGLAGQALVGMADGKAIEKGDSIIKCTYTIEKINSCNKIKNKVIYYLYVIVEYCR